MVDLDNVFKYSTQKYVYIRDAKLGILKYSLMVLIFLYVVVYDLFIVCTHLKPHHATGFGQILLRQPQDIACNEFDRSCHARFDTIDKLKYCTQSKKSSSSKEIIHSARDYSDAGTGDGSADSSVGDYVSTPRKCRYFDGLRLQWEASKSSEIFIPTRYRRVKQNVSDSCYDPIRQTIRGEEGGRSQYSCRRPWNTLDVQDFYVADVGEFDLLLTHSFNSPALSLSGTSQDYQGFFAACESETPMTPKEVKTNCKRMAVPHTSGDVAPEDLENLTSTKEMGVPSLTGYKDADLITLGDLLKLTPIAQRNRMERDILDLQFPKYYGHPGESLREKGGMLMLDVSYSNTGDWRPGFGFLPQKQFGVKPITYTYRTAFIPTPENVKYQLIQDPAQPNFRIVDKWYGITIHMTFNGQLVKYVFSKVLTALTTGLVLLSMATTVVTLLASYVLHLKDKYELLMYQLSEDFSDYIMLAHHTQGQSPSSPSSYWVGDKLNSKLGRKYSPDGTEGDESQLSDEDTLAILCATEFRLSRMDGMDPMMIFREGEEMDKRNYKIGDYARDFYMKVMGNAGQVGHMSYRLQGHRRQEIKGASSQKLGTLENSST